MFLLLIQTDILLIGLVTRSNLVDIVYDTLWGGTTTENQGIVESKRNWG